MQQKLQKQPVEEPHHQPQVSPASFDFNIYFMRGNEHRNLTHKQQIQVAEIVRLDPLSRSFYLFNTYEAERKIRRWKELLPWITPHYAIKCNPYLELTTILTDHGAGIDCASQSEIEKAFELKIHPQRIVYSNPKKDENDLKWAGEHGITLTTADTIAELYKIRKYAPKMRILWRVSVQAPQGGNIIVNFANKFGDDIQTDEEITERMKQIAEAGFNLMGTHFHCGCGHQGSKGHQKGIELSRRIITIGRKFGHQMKIMDLGGGWSAGEMTEEKAKTLQQSHGDLLDYKVIAEPGRHLSENMFHLLIRVIAKHVKKTQIGYYVNDSMYMNLCGTKIDDIDLTPKGQIYSSISGKDLTIKEDIQLEQAVIFGMTCDGIDIICTDVSIPKTLKIGDWFCIGGMGAYSYGIATNFNGMKHDKFVHWEVHMQG